MLARYQSPIVCHSEPFAALKGKLRAESAGASNPQPHLVQPQVTLWVMRSEHAYVRTLLHPRSHLGVLTPRSTIASPAGGRADLATAQPPTPHPPTPTPHPPTLNPQPPTPATPAATG